MYFAIKHFHMTLVLVSVALLIVRYVLRLKNAAALQGKLLKILPHAVDTFLLLSAIYLCIYLGIYPFSTGWLTEKFILLFVYIFLGIYTLKIADSALKQTAGMVLGLLCIGTIAHLAISKQAFLFS